MSYQVVVGGGGRRCATMVMVMMMMMMMMRSSSVVAVVGIHASISEYSRSIMRRTIVVVVVVVIVVQGEAVDVLTKILLSLLLLPHSLLQSAVTNFNKNYEIYREIVQTGAGSMSSLTESQVFLGIAKGNSILSQHITAVSHSLGPLLDFKLSLNEKSLAVKR